jgi:hypothetical protein
MDSAGARGPARSLTKTRTSAPRTLAFRTIAVCIVGLLMAPAIIESAGWSSAAGRHACCRDRGPLAPETRMTNCCAMSEQSNEGAPPETQPVRTTLKLLAPQVVPVALSTFASQALLPGESSSLRRAAIVPLYLQQASLLI